MDDLRAVNAHQNIHSFRWLTPHACPKERPKYKSIFKTLRNKRADVLEEPPAGDDNEGNGELIPSESRKTRKWVAVAIVLLV